MITAILRGSLTLATRQEIAAFRRTMRNKLRQAGNVVRRRQRGRLKQTSIHLSETRRRDATGKKATGDPKRGSTLLAGHAVVVRRLPGTRHDWAVLVGPKPAGPALYGKFLDRGTAERVTTQGFRRGRIRPTPWLHPAYGDVEDQVVAILGESYTAIGWLG